MSNAIVLFEVTVADGCQDAYLERAAGLAPLLVDAPPASSALSVSSRSRRRASCCPCRYGKTRPASRHGATSCPTAWRRPQVARVSLRATPSRWRASAAPTPWTSARKPQPTPTRTGPRPSKSSTSSLRDGRPATAGVCSESGRNRRPLPNKEAACTTPPRTPRHLVTSCSPPTMRALPDCDSKARSTTPPSSIPATPAKKPPPSRPPAPGSTSTSPEPSPLSTFRCTS